MSEMSAAALRRSRDAGPVRPAKEESDKDAAHSGEHAASDGHRQAPSQGATQTHERSP